MNEEVDEGVLAELPLNIQEAISRLQGIPNMGWMTFPPQKKNMFMFWPRHIIIMAVGQSSDCRIRHVGLCLSLVIIKIYQTWYDFDMSTTGHIFLCFLSCCEAETISLTTTHVSGSKTGLDSQEKGWIWGEFTWIYHVLPYFTIFCHILPYFTIFCHPVNYYCYGNPRVSTWTWSNFFSPLGLLNARRYGSKWVKWERTDPFRSKAITKRV